MMGMGIRLAIGAGAAVVVAIGAMAILMGATSGPSKQPSVSLAISTPVASPAAVVPPPGRLARSAPGAGGDDPRRGILGQHPSGGASSLQETYDDWQVACGQQGGVKRCAMGQQQISKENRQRVLDIELWPSGDKLEGALMLPFGLALDQGVTLQIDDAARASPCTSAPACRAAASCRSASMAGACPPCCTAPLSRSKPSSMAAASPPSPSRSRASRAPITGRWRWRTEALAPDAQAFGSRPVMPRP